MLVDRFGVDVNKQVAWHGNRGALHAAIGSFGSGLSRGPGIVQIVEFLLKNGADPFLEIDENCQGELTNAVQYAKSMPGLPESIIEALEHCHVEAAARPENLSESGHQQGWDDS